jgi:hypothetical protein
VLSVEYFDDRIVAASDGAAAPVCYLQRIVTDQRTNSVESKRRNLGLTWAVVGFVTALAVLWLGTAQLASLSGELPDFGPTAAESATWSLGQVLTPVGALLLVVWAALLAAFHTRLGLSGGALAIMLVGALVVTILGTLIVWMLVLPPLTAG